MFRTPESIAGATHYEDGTALGSTWRRRAPTSVSIMKSEDLVDY